MREEEEGAEKLPRVRSVRGSSRHNCTFTLKIELRSTYSRELKSRCVCDTMTMEPQSRKSSGGDNHSNGDDGGEQTTPRRRISIMGERYNNTMSSKRSNSLNTREQIAMVSSYSYIIFCRLYIICSHVRRYYITTCVLLTLVALDL